MKSQQQLPVLMAMIPVSEWQMLISSLASEENKCYVQQEVKEEYLPKDANPVLGPSLFH